MEAWQKPVKCLGIACSPRTKGNTTALLEKALDGAREAGAETELLALGRFKFAPCIACNGCFTEGQCVVPDDMQVIYQKLLEADRIIIAAPIFSMGLCAQAKAVVDRGQRFWATKHILKRPVIDQNSLLAARRGIFISCAGSDLPDVFSGAERVVRYYFKMLEVEYLGSYLYRQVDEVGAIHRRPEALQEIFQAGKDLASK